MQSFPESVDGKPRPAYSALGSDEISGRAEKAMAKLVECRLCPRDCRVNRIEGETGFCGAGRRARIASAFAHMGEEDCLRGKRGSGTIFFGQCNLRCVFCQNCDISQAEIGRESGPDEIAELMLGLESHGCHNVNLVTPSHVVPQLLEALVTAVKGGLKMPIVFNTSAYDRVDTLRLLDGLVDIYMPDFKFWSEDVGERMAGAPDYGAVARAAIAEMHRQVGFLRTDGEGVAFRGVLVRHLVMPGQGADAEKIMAWLAKELGPDTYVNIMGQYRPENVVGRRGKDGTTQFAEIDRLPLRTEMIQARRAAKEAGLWRLDKRAFPSPR